MSIFTSDLMSLNPSTILYENGKRPTHDDTTLDYTLKNHQHPLSSLPLLPVEPTASTVTKGGKATSDKRKTQNRSAQRNFRERKEKNTTTLEARVNDLENVLNARIGENASLRVLLVKLREDNERLQLLDLTLSSSKSSATASLSPPPVHNLVPFDLNDLPFDFTFPFLPTLPTPPTSNPSSSADPSPSPSAGVLEMTYDPEAAPDPFDYSFLDSPLPSFTSFASPSALPSSVSPYSVNIPSPESMLSYSNVVIKTEEEEEEECKVLNDVSQLASFMNLPSPSPSFAATNYGTEFRDVTYDLDEANPCPELLLRQRLAKKVDWTKACEDPFNFDLDGLCSEMRAKATCQEAARLALASAIEEDEKLINATSKY